mmetsp:Transcript_18668/g.51221  ORF Transcript_18668/g.51221 Transcript_18668/m.51221 type:complete len:209 (+) Transcript_18668:656-1282(+)
MSINFLNVLFLLFQKTGRNANGFKLVIDVKSSRSGALADIASVSVKLVTTFRICSALTTRIALYALRKSPRPLFKIQPSRYGPTMTAQPTDARRDGPTLARSSPWRKSDSAAPDMTVPENVVKTDFSIRQTIKSMALCCLRTTANDVTKLTSGPIIKQLLRPRASDNFPPIWFTRKPTKEEEPAANAKAREVAAWLPPNAEMNSCTSV